MISFSNPGAIAARGGVLRAEPISPVQAAAIRDVGVGIGRSEIVNAVAQTSDPNSLLQGERKHIVDPPDLRPKHVGPPPTFDVNVLENLREIRKSAQPLHTEEATPPDAAGAKHIPTEPSVETDAVIGVDNADVPGNGMDFEAQPTPAVTPQNMLASAMREKPPIGADASAPTLQSPRLNRVV
jgi:hypothetical protein